MTSRIRVAWTVTIIVCFSPSSIYSGRKIVIRQTRIVSVGTVQNFGHAIVSGAVMKKVSADPAPDPANGGGVMRG